jgi:uncharacterized protein (TIRG00374 family)
MSQKTKARWKLLLNLATFVAMAILVYAIRHQIWDSIRNIHKVHAYLLLLLPVWQLFNYDAYTRQYHDLFKTLGENIKYKFLYIVTLELNFVNHVFPSGGVSGFSYFSLRMKEKNVSTAKSSLVQLLRFILVFISFQLLMFIGLIMLTAGGHVNRFVLLTAGSLGTLVVVGTIVIAYVVGSKQRINSFFGFLTGALNSLIHIVRPNHPETINVARAQNAFEELHENYMIFKADKKSLKMPLVWSLVANLTEILTLYTVYVAFGHWVNPGAVILAYAVANFAGFISVLPGGIGVYETLMTAILAVGGVSPAISIPVTVMYRVISMSVQLLPGYYLYYRNLHKKPA